MYAIKKSAMQQPSSFVFLYLLGLSFTVLFVDRPGQSTLIDEFLLLAMLPFASIGIYRKYFSIGLPAKLVIIYFALAVLSSVVTLASRDDIPFAAPVLGLLLDAKFIIFLGALFYLAQRSKKSNDEIIIDICRVIFLIGLINSIFFLRDIFSGGTSLLGINLRTSPIFGYIPIGLFSHKVSAATLSALSLISCFVLYFSFRKRTMLVCMVAFSIILIFASSFKELIAIFLIYFIALRALYSGQANMSRAGVNIILGSLLVVPVFFIFLGEQVVSLVHNRVSVYGYEETVRGLLYEKSAMIASDYFPLGSGAGTFSSQPSRDMYYSPLYHEYQLSHYYGATPENPGFLMDVGWAKFLAEAGWVGGGAYAFAYVFVFISISKSMIRKPSVVNIFGVLLGGLIFSSALGQSIFTAELGIPLCALVFFTYYLDVVRNGRRAL